jgi:hypothetical protein
MYLHLKENTLELNTLPAKRQAKRAVCKKKSILYISILRYRESIRNAKHFVFKIKNINNYYQNTSPTLYIEISEIYTYAKNRRILDKLCFS